MKNSCAGLLGFLFGHKFTARVDEQESLAPGMQYSGNIRLAEVIQASKVKSVIYKKDVCERCGQVIEFK